MKSRQPTKLAIWIIEHGMTQSRFARAIGITKTQIHNFCHGYRTPLPRNAAKIEDFTRGIDPDDVVTMRYWTTIKRADRPTPAEKFPEIYMKKEASL